MDKLIIVGISSTSKHVYSFVKMYNLYEVVGFAVNEKYINCDEFCGLPVYALETLDQKFDKSEVYLFVAMLWNKLNSERKNVYNYCKERGYKLANIVSPLASIRSEIKGDNCWIHDYVVIQNDSHIESNVMLMAFSLIGANTHVGAHCFFGAKSLLGGGGTIGEQSFVGINATIFDDTNIGKKCIIGACTPVKRNIPNYSKYVTASDNIVIKQYSEEEIENKLLFSKNVR